MKTKLFSLFRLTTGIAALTSGISLWAAPLAWFPGPSVDPPFSGAATTVFSGLGNLLVGGDGFAGYYYPLTYPESLNATDLYWNYLPAIYSLQIAPGAVATGGMIILYGGTDGAASMSAVVGYSPSGDTPQILASMSVPRSYLGYARDRNGRAYAIGGLDDNGQPLASVERFNLDIGTNGAWSAVASLPTARYDFPAVFDGTNSIYVFGGYADAASGVETASVLRYSVSKNSWTNLASMPVATAGSAAAFAVNGEFYVVGGVAGGVTTDTVQVYDPTSNSWTISTPLPEALTASAMGVDSLGRLIVMGGMDSNGSDVGDVWRSQQLSLLDSAPAFVTYPSNSATYQVTYVSSISATGSPPPTYSLVNGPGGMQVDTYSGAIIWTPQGLDQIGSIPVTIQAANYAGSINWNFTITVPNPRPIPVTNLTVVGVTESSVTLAWSPEDPVFGSVTYSVWLRHVLHDPKGSGATIWYTQIGGNTTETNITITGLAAGLSQTYYVVATGPGGVSGYTGIGATTLSAPPPTNLRVTGLTSTTITLAWDAPVGPVPVVSYRILGVFDGVFVQYPLSFVNIFGTTVTLTGLAPGRALLWGVCAYDAYGNISAYDYLPSLVVNPAPAAAALTAMPPAGNGRFQFTVQPSAVQTTLIQATTNPADPTAWTTIFTNPISAGPLTFTDANSSLFPIRFYRVVSP